MKDKLKVFLVALILGAGVSYFVCYKFDPPVIAFGKSSNATIVYVGSYTSLTDAQEKSKDFPNSIIYNDNNIYKVLIGVYSDKEVLSLMESYLNDKNIKYQISTLKVNSEFLNNIKNYQLLIKSSEKTYYENINKSILKVFNEYMGT